MSQLSFIYFAALFRGHRVICSCKMMRQLIVSLSCLCVLHHAVRTMAYIYCAMHPMDLSLHVSVSTEPLYSNDQYAHSYSNPYKQYQCDKYASFQQTDT